MNVSYKPKKEPLNNDIPKRQLEKPRYKYLKPYILIHVWSYFTDFAAIYFDVAIKILTVSIGYNIAAAVKPPQTPAAILKAIWFGRIDFTKFFTLKLIVSFGKNLAILIEFPFQRALTPY